MQLLEMKKDHHTALSKADGIITAAENAGRALTDAESRDVDAAMTEARALAPRIAAVDKQNTIRSMMTGGMLLTAPGRRESGWAGSEAPQTRGTALSTEYREGFRNWIASGGQKMDAAMYEGAGSAGGFAVPVEVAGEIVPLSPPERGIRKLALVVPTTNDIKIPRKASIGTAAAKAESGATVTSFVETGATLDQITLSAYMAGAYEKISFELAQDVPAFEAFVVSDLLDAQQTLEETYFISGTGGNQPQGVLGNVGAGVTEQPDSLSNPVSIDGTLNLVGALKGVYHENASFLMARPTSISIRKAQRQSNLYEPVWTRSNGTDYLHGYPVGYSSAMPTAVRGATPLLFGDFRQGYVIGDRGGPGINVKILDQPLAIQGQIAVLVYRRVDGRVRRSEAIQAYTIAAS